MIPIILISFFFIGSSYYLIHTLHENEELNSKINNELHSKINELTQKLNELDYHIITLQEQITTNNNSSQIFIKQFIDNQYETIST